MQMKRMLSIFFLSAVLALSFSVPALAGDVIRLTYSNFFPPTHVQSKLAESWCKEVEKRTGGKVQFQYFPGQTLTKAPQSYDGVVTGICDVAMSCFTYTRGRFPVMEVVDLPLGYTSGVQATNVVNKVFAELNPKELSDTKVLYLHAHGPGLLHTKDKPVKALNDIKGLKIRAHGTISEMVKALGAAPVTMPMPEVYQALEKGVVDGAFYPVEANKGWKLGEVDRFCTLSFPAAYTTSFFVVMNSDVWAKLPADAQKTIQEINAEWMIKHGQAWDAADAKGRKFLLSQKGRQVLELAPGQDAKWRAAIQPVLEGFVQKLKARKLDGDKALSVAQKTLAANAGK
jgi:TRAP-type C4-dicarboxylate transport system substrate-binding protein